MNISSRAIHLAGASRFLKHVDVAMRAPAARLPCIGLSRPEARRALARTSNRHALQASAHHHAAGQLEHPVCVGVESSVTAACALGQLGCSSSVLPTRATVYAAPARVLRGACLANMPEHDVDRTSGFAKMR